MSYSFYKLESQGYATFIVSDSCPQHNCQVTPMGTFESKKSAIMYRDVFAKHEGVGHQSHHKSVFEYKGKQYTSQKELAEAMGLTSDGLAKALKRFRSWESPWPDDLFEIICNKQLPHLKFKKEFRRHVLC